LLFKCMLYRYHASIHFPSVMIMFFAGYVPGFPMLYMYMLGQRKSVLAPKKKKKTA
jgi:very-long-chain (3R)-3-hydroxyacyl-CoA dehydratase